MKKIIKETSLPKNVTETRYIYALAGLVGISAILLGIWFIYRFTYAKQFVQTIIDPNSQTVIGNNTEQCSFRRVWDGICVTSVDRETTPLVAVMIENHPDARPQSGLSEASIVYEAPVESNYTRFLALYPETQEIKKVGPVRSARPYYLDWIQEYGTPLYLHVGGSPDALEKIKNSQISDINEFYNGKYFWRSTDRYAPHNVYTSSELWRQIPHESTQTTTSSTNWKFNTQKTEMCTANCTNTVSINFLSPDYITEWKFNTSTATYERYQSGKPHREQSGAEISADTIIVQFVQSRVLDTVGRIEMDTLGKGRAVVFQNGFVTDGFWKKQTETSRTEWVDSTGNPISLQPGTIWIEVANQNTHVEWE